MKEENEIDVEGMVQRWLDGACRHAPMKEELEALENWWYERAHEPVSSWDDIRNDAARRYAEGQFSAFRLIHKTMFGDEKFSLRQWVEIEGPDGVNWDWKEEESEAESHRRRVLARYPGEE